MSMLVASPELRGRFVIKLVAGGWGGRQRTEASPSKLKEQPGLRRLRNFLRQESPRRCHSQEELHDNMNDLFDVVYLAYFGRKLKGYRVFTDFLLSLSWYSSHNNNNKQATAAAILVHLLERKQFITMVNNIFTDPYCS